MATNADTRRIDAIATMIADARDEELGVDPSTYLSDRRAFLGILEASGVEVAAWQLGIDAATAQIWAEEGYDAVERIEDALQVRANRLAAQTERFPPRGEHYVSLVSGRPFAFDAPHAEDIVLADIAHALSHIARFNGHTSIFYSVAEHSVRASLIVPHQDALEALLHDAHEAYVGDVSTPLKWMLPDFRQLERAIEAVVRCRFGLKGVMAEAVKRADRVMLATEMRDLMPRAPRLEELDGVPMLPETIEPWTPEVARRRFIDRFVDLGGK